MFAKVYGHDAALVFWRNHPLDWLVLCSRVLNHVGFLGEPQVANWAFVGLLSRVFPEVIIKPVKVVADSPTGISIYEDFAANYAMALVFAIESLQIKEFEVLASGALLSVSNEVHVEVSTRDNHCGLVWVYVVGLHKNTGEILRSLASHILLEELNEGFSEIELVLTPHHPLPEGILGVSKPFTVLLYSTTARVGL